MERGAGFAVQTGMWSQIHFCGVSTFQPASMGFSGLLSIPMTHRIAETGTTTYVYE